jgi:predicted nuclease with RNAse H fold
MIFHDAVYVGIDPTAGRRPMHFTALDKHLEVVASALASQEEVLAFIGGLEAGVIGVTAPQGPGQEVMLRPDVRQRYNLRPGGRSWGKWRACEYDLRRRNIRMYALARPERIASGWIRRGYSLYRRLAEMGFQPFILGQATAPRTVIEVQPQAAYCTLLGLRPFAKPSLEGRLQRQLILYLEGLGLANPIRLLEEVTRHHLLTGQLPLDGLLEAEELEALVAAYTAFLTAIEPDRVTQVGEPAEGLITLPRAQLKDFYP